MAHLKGPANAGNLKIGDVVLLYYNADNLLPGSAEKSGFILADLSGFCPQQLLRIQATDASEHDITNVQFGTFKVLSSNKYEAQTHYRELVEKLNEFKRKKAAEHEIQLLQFQVTQAQRDIEVERAENAAKQRRLQGTNVHYGDSIQLLHTLTGKYVCVSTTNTSATENTKLRVYLQRKDSVGCIFRLHPHIKVQTVGEEVNYDDHIKFESVLTEGQYLHCSKKTFGDVNIKIFNDCSELNLSAKESPLKIIRHYRPISQKGIRTIKAGGIVRFFHRKHQCYIVAEGSFAGQYSHLEKVEDDDESEVDIADQLSLLSRQAPSPKHSSSRKVEVAADVEPQSSDDLSMPDSDIDTPVKPELLESKVPDIQVEDSETSKPPIKLLESANQLSVASPKKPGSLKASRQQEKEELVVFGDVHFQRKRRSGNLTSQVSTSPNTFWQIEKFKDQCSGEAMLFTEQCRIKHLPTRRYLAVTGNFPHYEVTLRNTDLLPASATVFELYPIVQQVRGEIVYDSHVRVKHRDTKTWLHLNKDFRYYTEAEESASPADLLDETGKQFKVLATKEINSDDAFTLEKVDDHLVSDFNHVASITAVLASQIQQCNLLGGKPHSPEECHMESALNTLHYMQALLSKKHRQDIKNKQKIMRCLQTLVLVVRLLNMHRKEDRNDPEVCTACFGIIISFLEGKSKRNKSHMSKMMRYIFATSVKNTESIGTQTVEKILVGIAKDNPSVLFEEGLMRSIIGHIMKTLQSLNKESSKIVQLFEILGALCSCKGVPVQQNQLIILEEFHRVHSEELEMSDQLLYPLRVREHMQQRYPEKQLTLSIDIEECTGEDTDTSLDIKTVEYQALTSFEDIHSGFWYPFSKGGKRSHKYLVAQLNLLVQMCRGDNIEVIQTLQGESDGHMIGVEIDFSLIMSAIEDDHVKISYPLLRAAFIDLLRVMYVEVGENRNFLEKFPFSFKINEVGPVPFESSTRDTDSEKAAITALTGVTNTHFLIIRDWIKRFLQDESEYFFAACEDDNNEVVVKVLQLLTDLVKFGYYDDPADVGVLLPAIHKLLNLTERPLTERFAARRQTDSAVTFKEESSTGAAKKFRGFHRMATEEFDEKIRKAVAMFRDTDVPQVLDDEEYQNHLKIKNWAMELLNLLFNFQLYKSLHIFIYDFLRLKRPMTEFQDVLAVDEFELVELKQPSLKKQQEIKSHLSTLMQTSPRQFNEKSAEKAKMIFETARNHLKQIIQRSDSLDLSDQNRLPQILLELASCNSDELIQHSLLLLDRYFTSQSDIFEKALQAKLLLTPQSVELHNTLERLFLDLTAYLNTGSEQGSKGKRKSSPVKQLIKYCWLEDEVEGFEPHQINQNIILSFGIFQDVLNFVLSYCNGSRHLHKEDKKKLEECVAFLRALTCQNPAIQARLFVHLDTFMKGALGELGASIGELLGEIFRSNPTLTLSLKEKQLWKLTCILFVKDKVDSIMTNSALLDAFNEILLVKEFNLPLKNNQLKVMKFIGLINDDERYWSKDLLGDTSTRWTTLTAESDFNPRLVKLLMFTDLLATCAYGEITSVDAICCTIYSEEELIQIISSKEISLYRKRPFMKLLVWVYMNVHGDKADEKSKSYRKNESLWDHMSMMAAAISSLSEVMRDMPHSAYLSVKELVASPSWKYLHDCPDRKHTHEPRKIIMESDLNYKEDFNVSDLLLYLVEGLFPFLHTFSEFDRASHHEHSPRITAIKNDLYKAMLSLQPVLHCKRVYFSQENQVRLYYRALFLLKPHPDCDLSEELEDIEHSIIESGDVFQQEVVSRSREIYQAMYREEMELNEIFHKFVLNYKTAHEGRNTRKDQVTNTWKLPNSDLLYSDFLDQDMLKPGPKFLPLGRKFQEHVALFSSHAEDQHKNPKEKLLKQLEISLSQTDEDVPSTLDPERQAQLDIKCLQILRATIYNQIIRIDEEDKDRNPEKYRRQCEHQVHAMQNEIQDLGNAVLRVVPFLAHPDERIVTEVVAFLEALLEFGNTHVQDGLKAIIHGQTQNIRVFPTVKGILQRASTIYRGNESLFEELKSRIAADRRILESMSKTTGTVDEAESSYKSSYHRHSVAATEGTLLVKRKRQSGTGFFGRRESTKVVLMGENRVPFMALFEHTEKTAGISERALDMLHSTELSHATLITKVLGLMCDGQHRDMQTYLRKQSEDIHNVNMVAVMASYLEQFSKRQAFNTDTLRLFNQLLQALTEFCIGNLENRRHVFEANIISVINFALRIDITKIKGTGLFDRRVNTTIISRITDFDDIESTVNTKEIDYVFLRKIALEMKIAAVQLLDVLLEQISPKTVTLSHQIAEGLDITALHWSMLDFYILMSDSDLIRAQYEDNAARALFDCYGILMHLMDIKFVPVGSLKPTEKKTLKAWDYCEERSRSIEVVYRDEEMKEEVLTRVHFNANVESDIREQLRDTVKFQVDRSTHGDKLRDFHEWMVAIKKDTLHYEKLRRNHLKSITLLSRTRYWLLLLITLLLNIFFMIYYEPQGPGGIGCPHLFAGAGNFTLNPALNTSYVIANFVLGTLYFLLTVWMLLEYFIVTWPHFVLPEFLYTLQSLCQRVFERYSWSRFNLLPNVERTYSSINIFGVKTIYLILFLAIAVSPFYCFGVLYSISLLYIVIDNDILQRALLSVTKNWKSLMWVAILLLIITYIYSVMTFSVLREPFNSMGNDDTPSVFCETLNECFVTVLLFGLVDNFLEVPIETAADARVRFVFDVSFFIIVTTIGLNIVFGIIVDTFSELRDAKYNAEQDMKSTCFVCDLPSHEFERLGNNGFERHWRKDHNMWAYVYYSIYLDRIDSTNHNAIEKYVYEKINSGNIDYIPFRKALVLEGLEEGEELKREVQKLKTSVNSTFNALNKRFDGIEHLMKGADQE